MDPHLSIFETHRQFLLVTYPSEQLKILWDFNIFCDHIIRAHRPDVIVVYKLKNLITLVDVSIPADKRITEEKTTKF